MIRAHDIRPAGHWAASEAADCATLTFEMRWARRRRVKTDSGADILIDLAHARVLDDGDGLVLEDGRIVRVAAALEQLLEVASADPAVLARIAWHLGNRHTPAAIDAGRILVQRDHVLAGMLLGLAASVREVSAPFTPERGAYAEGGHHRHDHDHGRDHDH